MQESSGAENLLLAVSSVGEAIGKTLNDTGSKTILKKNLGNLLLTFYASSLQSIYYLTKE